MQNLQTQTCTTLPNTTLNPHATATLPTYPNPTLYTAEATAPTEITLKSHNPTKPLLTLPTALPATSPLLVPLPPALLLATRAGELFALTPSPPSAEPLGDVLHDDPACSGILAAAAAPDGNLVAFISPLHTLLLSPSADLLAEVPHPDTAVADAACLSWRPDGQFLAVAIRTRSSTVAAAVIDRSGSSVKPLDLANVQCGTAAPLIAFEPRVGGFVVLSAGHGGSLVFFERNGLRHLRSDFVLWEGEDSPTLLEWSPGGQVLAAVRADPVTEGSELCLYARVNYRWYCRKRVAVSGEIVAVHWDEDVPGRALLYVADGRVVCITFRSVPSTVGMLGQGACAAVVDGEYVCLTNFSHALLPPPMCHGVIEFAAAVEAVCFREATDTVGALLADGRFATARIVQPLRKAQVESRPKGNGGKIGQRMVWKLGRFGCQSATVLPFRMPVMVAEDLVVVVDYAGRSDSGEGGSSDVLRAYRLVEFGDAVALGEYAVDGSVCAMSQSARGGCRLTLATSKGAVLRVYVDDESGDFAELVCLKDVVSATVTSIAEFKVGSERCLTLVHDDTGLLSVMDLSTESVLTVSRQCTSFCVHAGFLSFTTQSHLLYCALLDKRSSKSYQADKDDIPSLLDALNSEMEQGMLRTLPEGKGATRPIDRGSLIVTALPDDVAIVLQAPRGNLETIRPRPVVFEAVDRYAKSADYVNGFKLCRKQRIDMNHLVDADYPLFLQNTEGFVKQVEKASNLSVFMTFLRGETEKVNSVCDSIVKVLKESEQSERYTSAITTGLIRRDPSDFEGALDEVRKARKRSEEEGAAALDYLFVLIKKEEKVYEYALGTYDLALSLFVARSSQMDPAEYSQELKQFSLLETTMRKYSIDMRLERYDRALGHLYACGESKYPECVALCHEHALYETGLTLFRNNSLLRPGLLDGYGKHLQSEKRYLEAAAVFIENGDYRSACESYRDGGQWQLSANAAWQCEKLSLEGKRKLLESLVDELVQGGRIREAAQVRAAHLGDTGGAIELLCESEDWEAAFEVAGMYSARESLKSETGMSASALKKTLLTAVTEGAEAVLATIRENRTKLHERRKRLEVVREAKRAMAERLGTKRETDDADSDVFSASTASSLVSNLSDVTFASRTSAATSVYTTATSALTGPLTAAKLEKQAEKRKRKIARKRIREGHPREEEYLVGYLQKLVPAEFLRKRVAGLGKALLFLSRPDLLKSVLDEMQAYVDEAKLLPADVLDGEGLREALLDRSWAESSAVVNFL